LTTALEGRLDDKEEADEEEEEEEEFDFLFLPRLEFFEGRYSSS
jgi:hypothetical protein